MDTAAQNEGQEPHTDRPIAISAPFEGSAEIAEARDMARDFLTSVQAEHGLPVPTRASHGGRYAGGRARCCGPAAARRHRHRHLADVPHRNRPPYC